MAWPLTREEIATGANPISSHLANLLQDAIIGAKHGEIRIPIPGAALYNGHANIAIAGAALSFTGAASVVWSPLLAEGTTIKTIEVAYNRVGAGSVTLELRTKNALTGATNTPHTTTDTTSPSGLVTHLFTLNYELPATTGIVLVGAFANTHILHGLELVAFRD